MQGFSSKIFLTVVLLISSITYSQTVLLNQGPSAPTGPASNCTNHTGGDPTINTFTHIVNTDCYDSIDITVVLNSIAVPGRTSPGSLDSSPANKIDRVRISINGTLVDTMLGNDLQMIPNLIQQQL